MPFTMPDFGRISFEEANPFLKGLGTGQQLMQNFMKFPQELQKAILENQLSQQKYQWNPKIWQSEIGLRNSQAPYYGALTESTKLGSEKSRKLMPYVTQQAEQALQLQKAQADKINFLLKHPGLMGGPESRDIEALTMMGYIPSSPQQPSGNSAQYSGQVPSLNTGNQPLPIIPQTQTHPFNTGNPLVDAMLNRKYIQSGYQQQMASGYNWAHLPVETKNQYVAQGYGMGIDPLKMMDYINKGYGIQQIAQLEGLDPDNLPAPMYPPTSATKTRVQQVEQVGRELDYLSSASTALIKPFASTYLGLSPPALSAQVSGNEEEQRKYGKYLGALSVQTGIANGRTLLEGGRPGVQVMKMVKESALKGIDQHSPIRMTPIMYEEAQKTIDNLLQRGAKIRTTTGMNPMSEIGRAHGKPENASSETGKVTRRFKWKNGKLEKI